MFKYAVVTGVFILLTHFKNINGWRSFTVSLTNSSTTVYTDKASLNMTVTKNNLINIYLTINEEIKEPMTRIEIMFYSADTGRYDVEVMNRTIDSCKFFRNKLYEPLMQLIFQIMLEYGDFPKSCPLKPKTYRIENMPIDAERLPPYLPERKGYFKVYFFTKESEFWTSATEGVVFFDIKSLSLKRFNSREHRLLLIAPVQQTTKFSATKLHSNVVVATIFLLFNLR